MPSVTIIPEAREHALRELISPTRKRNPCPLGMAPPMVVPGFWEHLPKLFVKSNASRSSTIANLRRMFGMLKFTGESLGENWWIGRLVALYELHVMEEVLNLDVMNPLLTWTPKLLTAVQHLCEYGVVRCKQLRWKRAEESVRNLEVARCRLVG